MKNYRINIVLGSQKLSQEESQIMNRGFSSEKEARDCAEKLKQEGKIKNYSISSKEVR